MKENNKKNILAEKFGGESRWVNWKLETRDKKQTKIPYSISGKFASSTDPTTWATYSEVKAMSDKVGIVLLPDKKLMCVDLDHVIKDGKIEHPDKEIIANFILESDSYTEISNSNEGLHVFISLTEPIELEANRKTYREVYVSGRYIAVTGNHYGEPKEVRTVTPEEAIRLLKILNYPWRDAQPSPASLTYTDGSIDDETLLQKMFSAKNGDKIKALYNGDITAYNNDDSAADMALVSYLAFWTAKNAIQMERIWLASPIGSRSKTQDRKDYRERTIRKAIESCTETFSSGEKQEVRNQVAEEDYGLVTIRACDVTPKNIQWLWDGKIAKGKLTLVVGNPGLGKSQITASIAACVSTGNPWPLHSEDREPAKVMILSGEDDFDDTIVPRLMAYEADLASISLIQFSEEIDKKGKKTQRTFSLTSDIPKLEREFSRLKNVDLLIVDPITAYMGDADSHNNADVRAVFAQLSAIASKHKVAVIAVTHFNKNANTDAQMRVMGSVAFVAAARAAFLVIKDEADESKRLFLPMKNNLAIDIGGLSYRIESKTIPVNDEDIKTSIIIWGNEEVKMTASEAMRGNTKDKSPQVKEAEEFLTEVLTDKKEGIDGKTIKEMAKEASITTKNLYIAADNLGVVQEPNGFGKARIWKLLDNVFVPDKDEPLIK